MLKKMLYITLVVVSCSVGFIAFKNLKPFLIEFWYLLTENGSSQQKYNPSAFGKLTNQEPDLDPNAKLSPEVEEEFANDPEGYNVFKYGWGTKLLDKNTSWDYKTVPVITKVKVYDPSTKKLKVEVESPISSPIYQQTVIVDTTICTTENTYVYVNQSGTTVGNLDFFQDIDENSKFMSFCVDNECNNFGKMCKLFFY